MPNDILVVPITLNGATLLAKNKSKLDSATVVAWLLIATRRWTVPLVCLSLNKIVQRINV